MRRALRVIAPAGLVFALAGVVVAQPELEGGRAPAAARDGGAAAPPVASPGTGAPVSEPDGGQAGLGGTGIFGLPPPGARNGGPPAGGTGAGPGAGGAPDGGRASPPAVQAPAGDGGVPVPPGPGAESADRAEIRRLREELDRLQTRVGDLEASLAESQREAERLRTQNERLEELRDQVSEGNQQQAAREEQRQASMADLEGTINVLRQADYLLAGGNLDVDGLLAQAQVRLRGQAAAAVADARSRVANRDLFNARVAVHTAIDYAVQARLNSGSEAFDAP